LQQIQLIFPHQLFKDISHLNADTKIYLLEETLFFNQYKFHQQKIKLHRASMKAYAQYLQDNKLECIYIDAQDKLADVAKLIEHLSKQGSEKILLYDVCDFNLNKKIVASAKKCKMHLQISETLLFINTNDDLENYFAGRKKYFQTDFYVQQRKTRNVLIEQGDQPMFGKWSFDADNRLKYPKGKIAPAIKPLINNLFDTEAEEYVNKHFSKNFGTINKEIKYPSTFAEAEQWLNIFLQTRFDEFGLYEDAIVQQENYLHHSILTPMLNIGLLLPKQIINAAINYAQKNNVAYNSLEGFVRQILGWREFIRGIYTQKSVYQRTKNYWGFEREMPAGFYDGSTGIAPLDDAIKKVLATGYNHHIERLMVLSNFMLLCEIKPNAVYKWFMEMYIDAYDWVMVPNVYGMSQFADGGMMCTKPYISGSNYLFKMSDYKKGEPWAEIWDALFWRFMNVHRQFFLSNPRIGMLVHTFDKMDAQKQNNIMQTAEKFLNNLK
jgi:deoxyribodipyrimidine photolyase-related protein